MCQQRQFLELFEAFSIFEAINKADAEFLIPSKLEARLLYERRLSAFITIIWNDEHIQASESFFF